MKISVSDSSNGACTNLLELTLAPSELVKTLTIASNDSFHVASA